MPEVFDEHVGADVRPAGAGLPGRPHARLHVHDGARAQHSGPIRRSASTEPHHALSHHENKPDKIARTPRSTPTTSSCSPGSSRSCRTTPDGDGSLLDHSLILYGSGMGNGNVHSHVALPLVAGTGGGAIKGNRHIMAREHDPSGNLLLSMVRQVRHRTDERRDQHGTGGAVKASRDRQSRHACRTASSRIAGPALPSAAAPTRRDSRVAQAAQERRRGGGAGADPAARRRQRARGGRHDGAALGGALGRRRAGRRCCCAPAPRPARRTATA